MIKNELNNLFNNLYNNRANKKNEAGGNAADSGKAKGRDNGAQAANDATQAQAKKPRRSFVDEYEKSKDGNSKTETKANADTVELTSEEKRRAALQKIMDKLDAEEAARYPSRVNKKDRTESKDKTEKTDGTNAAANLDDVKNKDGIGALLNDMPLFNEFKTGLMEAFRSMDGVTSGSIRAQYELNYSSMQYIADAGGKYQYQETSLNIKLDLNYVKAGAGDMSGAEIADAIGNAEDFESFVAALKDISGIKMRVQESQIVVDTWKALGTLPVTVSYSETYTALQTGVADAAENELSTFETMKWYEPCEFLMLTEHSIILRPIIISEARYDSLSEAHRAILAECGREAAALAVKYEREFEANAFKTLEGFGIEIVPLNSKQEWIDATDPIRKDFAKRYGLEALMAEIEAAGK